MDVIIEGKITPDEPIAEVVQTCVDLKSVANPVLRLTDERSDLEGRVLFAQGGYILGARVNNTEIFGYDAVRKLLTIKTGNYAVLDPGRSPFTDINQTLWLLGSRVIGMLPDLPTTPDTLLDLNPNRLAASTIRPATGQVDFRHSGDVHSEASTPTIASVQSKARKFNKSNWERMRLTVACFLVVAGFCAVILYYTQILAFIHRYLHF